jgi:hypothetical protein
MPNIQIKRGLSTALIATNPIVASGEPIFEIDTLKLKIGDGVTAYSGLSVVGSGYYALVSHSHSSSQISDFNSSVSGLLPITNIIAGNRINVAISGTTAIITNNDTRWDLFLPPAPTGLAVTAGNTQVLLSWSAPTVAIQTPITDYTVQYSANSGSSWTTFNDGTSTATSAAITGLTNGTAYVFRVAAVNTIGTGAYTAASSSVTPAAPILSVTLTSGGRANSWRWLTGGYSDSEIWIGRGDDGITLQSTGWRTTFTPASKPIAIASATFTLQYSWATATTAFTVVLQGAKLGNAGQGLQGTSPTTSSATASATGSGMLTFDCTAVIAEIIGQSGWTPGNSIVLYLSGENAATDRVIYAADSAGSLVINYS